MNQRLIAVLLIIVVLLASGVSFVRSLFGHGAVMEEIAILTPQERDVLLNSKEFITFKSDPLVAKSREEISYLAVKNERDQVLVANILGGFRCTASVDDTSHNLIDLDSYSQREIGPKSSEIIPFAVKVDSKAPRGIYKCELNVTANNELYASKEFRIEYRP